jgi:hypothetical protein
MISKWQVLSRKRLLVGDHFRHVAEVETTFTVQQEHQGISIGIFTASDGETSVHGKAQGARKLKVACHGGGWSAWMDLDTGFLSHDLDGDHQIAKPFDEMVEILLS